jgi:hypothetical protein
MKLLSDLAATENELYLETISIYRSADISGSEERLNRVFSRYREVHAAYAELASNEPEALKRGLFLQWYALAEPPFLTGLNALSADAEQTIIGLTDERLRQPATDDELGWMLHYYSAWEWIFARFTDAHKLDEFLKSEKRIPLPASINRDAMALRGQMGYYWNSLSVFQPARQG